MSPVVLGILLGIANVIANAILFATVGSEPRGAGMVAIYGMLPGIVAGSLIGALAGAIAQAPRVARWCTLALPAAMVVVVLGSAFGVSSFVPAALIPTLLCVLILEACTRTAPDAALSPSATDAAGEDGASAVADLRPPRSAVRLAMALGAVVMLIVMAGVFASEDPHMHWLFEGYLPWGLGCGLGLAAPFGVLADLMREAPVWSRRCVLLGCAFALTAMLGLFVRLEDMIMLAFIPPAAGCLVLERYSRPPVAVPLAVAR